MARDKDENTRIIARMRTRAMASIESMAELPHVSCKELHGRVFHLCSFYDEQGEWHSWFPHDGKIIPMAAVPSEGTYYCKTPEGSDDLYFSFLDFIFQSAAWKKESIIAHGVLSDLHNLGTSLEKLRILHQQPVRSARMAATELEYIFLVCRSMLDSLQETIASIWVTVTLTDSSLKKKPLPKSFRKMVMSDRKRMTAEEISKRHQLPLPFAELYAECAEFLEWLREYRDALVHSGESLELVFVLDDGFGVSTEARPFSSMTIWSEHNTRENNIGSLKAAASYVISRTLATFDQFARLLVATIKFPPPFAAGYGLYVKGPHIGQLNHLTTNIHESPWY